MIIDRYLFSMLRSILVAVLVALSAAAYSQDLATKLAYLTVAAYCKPPTIENWSCLPCKSAPMAVQNAKAIVNSTQDTLGFIATSKQLQSIIISFRGTVPWDLKNWISDLNFITTSYPLCSGKCNVHRGFYSAFTDVKKQVFDQVAAYKQKYGFKNIVVTGHSLGAAIATHAVAHFITSGLTVSEFYTFGSPRVGDDKFAIWFDEIYGKTRFKARVTHGRDPVPHLPLNKMGFYHVTHQIFYQKNVKYGYKTCNDGNAKQDPTCSDQYYVDPLITDHNSYMDIDYAGDILKCH